MGTRHTPKFPSPSSMRQKRKLQQKRIKSRAWLEAECLKIARRTLGGSEIQLVTIRRLHPKGAGPNWKVADIIPQPTAPVSEVVRRARPFRSSAIVIDNSPAPSRLVNADALDEELK